MSLPVRQVLQTEDLASDRLSTGVANDHSAGRKSDLVRRRIPVAEWLETRDGAIVALVGYPAVARKRSFRRVRVMADHGWPPIDDPLGKAIKARADISNDLMTQETLQ